MVGFFCQVDKHIRRLDGDLSRFEQELQMKDPGARRLSVTSPVDLQSPAQSRESDSWTVSQLVGTTSLVPRLSPANPNPNILLWCRGESLGARYSSFDICHKYIVDLVVI